MINKLKAVRRYFIYQFKFGIKMFLLHLNGENIYVCVESPVHGNIGDQALALCRINLLTNIVGINEKNIIEFTSRDRMLYFPFIKKSINNTDIIILRGGGYFGDLWKDDFITTLKFIDEFRENKIVIFPQSVYFSDTLSGNKILKKSIKIINNHQKLFMFARDENSYKLMKQYYECDKIFLTPDTVLSFKPSFQKIQRKNQILLCMRNDKEKKVSNDFKAKIISTISKQKINYVYQDTVIDYNMKNIIEQKDIVIELLKKFVSCKLIITDRMHGMIFSAITGTPCIVLNNIDGKVKNQYKWIKSIGYVTLVDENCDIEKCIRKMISMDNSSYPLEKILVEFSPLINLIKEFKGG
ncbi:polysaccharide pyruvyl transferase family protein [Thomasclavelia sp.]